MNRDSYDKFLSLNELNAHHNYALKGVINHDTSVQAGLPSSWYYIESRSTNLTLESFDIQEAYELGGSNQQYIRFNNAGTWYPWAAQLCSGYQATWNNNDLTNGIHWINGYYAVANKAFDFHYILIAVRGLEVIFQVAIPIANDTAIKTRTFQNNTWSAWS